MKLYAYSDGDGFIHYNILKGEAIWIKGEWAKREQHFDLEFKSGRISILKTKILMMIKVYKWRLKQCFTMLK